MGVTVAELARRVGGQVRGNGQLLIDGAQSVTKAGPSEITFAADEQNVKKLKQSGAGAALVAENFAAGIAEECPALTLLVTSDPLDSFLAILREFRPQHPRSVIGISPQAFVHASARIASGCNIYPGAYIGARVSIGPDCDIHSGAVVGDDCQIGAHCVLHPHAVLYPDVVLGNRVIIHAAAVLGADGFGFRFRDGRYHKIPQLGSVLIQDDVEIGACTTIDRGMIGPTTIGEGTKLDNLVMIGHNCELGRHNAFASQVGLAGSVTTGDFVRCAGQVGIADHVHLGTGSSLGAKAGVHKDMAPGGNYVGIPATEEHEQFKMVMSLRKLPELRKQMRELESRIEEMARQIHSLATPSLEA